MPSAAIPPAGPFAAEVAAVIRGAMARKQLQQAQMARMTGISATTLSKLLRGAKPINLDQLEALCSALQLDSYSVIQEAAAEVQKQSADPATVVPLTRKSSSGPARTPVGAGRDRAVAHDPGYLPDEDPDVLD